MTKQEKILERAIRKAIKRGWDGKLNSDSIWEPDHHAWFDVGKGEDGEHVYPEDVWAELIFNHDFAKALWGEEPESLPSSRNHITSYYAQVPWEFHLQRMVIADDPIAYLGKHL